MRRSQICKYALEELRACVGSRHDVAIRVAKLGLASGLPCVLRLPAILTMRCRSVGPQSVLVKTPVLALIGTSNE
jgi:hypothetical protein